MRSASVPLPLVCSALLLGACAPDEMPLVEAAAAEPPLVLRVTRPDESDWPQIERRGLLRVLVPRDRTNHFCAGNRLRGMGHELAHDVALIDEYCVILPRLLE